MSASDHEDVLSPPERVGLWFSYGDGSAAADGPGEDRPAAAVIGAALLAGVVAGLGIAVPVGAVAAYLVGLAARTRFAVAAGAALGVATVDGAYALFAALGGVGLQGLVLPVAGQLTVLAVVILVGLGARIVWIGVLRYHTGSALDSVHAEVGSPARAYLGMVMLTAVNPTTVVYFLALVVGQQVTSFQRSSWNFAVSFALGALLASGAWQLLLAGGGTALGRIVTGRGGQLLIAVVSGAILLVLALHLLL